MTPEQFKTIQKYTWNNDLPVFIKNQLDDLAFTYNCPKTARIIHSEYSESLEKFENRYKAPKITNPFEKEREKQQAKQERQQKKQEEQQQRKKDEQQDKQKKLDQKGQQQQDPQGQQQDQQQQDQQQASQGQQQASQDQQQQDQQQDPQDQQQDPQGQQQQGQQKQDRQQQGQQQSKDNNQSQSSSDGHDNSKQNNQNKGSSRQEMSGGNQHSNDDNYDDEYQDELDDNEYQDNTNRDDQEHDVDFQDQENEVDLGFNTEELDDDPNRSLAEREAEFHRLAAKFLKEHKQAYIEKCFRDLSAQKNNSNKLLEFKKVSKGSVFLSLPQSIKETLWKIPSLLGVYSDVIEGAKRGRPSSTLVNEMKATKGKLTNVRWSKLIVDYEINPTQALLDIVEHRAPVMRSSGGSGNGDFIVALDVSGSMGNNFDPNSKFSFFQLATTITAMFHSIKPVDIITWGDSHGITSDINLISEIRADQTSTEIQTLYRGLQELFVTKDIKYGTDLVIITDGQPDENNPFYSIAIKKIMNQNGGLVWLIDLVGTRRVLRDAANIPIGWAALRDAYLPVTKLEDLQSLVITMKKSLQKNKLQSMKATY